MRYTLVLMAMIFLSCSSNEEEVIINKEDILNIKVDKVFFNGNLYADFNYQNGRLSSIDLYSLIEIYATRTFSYEGDKLVRMLETYNGNCCDRLYKFTYENGKVVKSYETRTNDLYESYDVYKYENGRIVEFIKMEVADTYEIEATKTQFIYENEKLVSLVYPKDDVEIAVTVDDQKNPFYGMPYRAMDIFGFPLRSFPIPYNITTMNSSSGSSHDFQYTYNQDGLPATALSQSYNDFVEFIYIN
jgi:hypothetical protein